MSRTTRSKNWIEFKEVFGRIVECDDKNQAMSMLNGIRAGWERGQQFDFNKQKRIDLLRGLIDTYKKN